MSKRYSKEFKSQAVALLQSPGMTVAQAARDLGVAESQLYKWRKQAVEHGASAFPGKGNLLPQDAEIRRLKRANEQLRMERDILKKAAAYFAKENVRG
jgi:transposase